jgi:hypothetical protein
VSRAHHDVWSSFVSFASLTRGSTSRRRATQTDDAMGTSEWISTFDSSLGAETTDDVRDEKRGTLKNMSN